MCSPRHLRTTKSFNSNGNCTNRFLENIRKSVDLRQIDPLSVLTENNPKFNDLVAKDENAKHFIFGTLSNTIFPWEVYLRRDPLCQKRRLWAVLHLNKPGQWSKLINIGGTLHGGAIATIIDGAAGILFASSGYRGMTANISMNYRKPIPLPSVVFCKASIERVDNRKVYISVSITNGDDQFGTIDNKEHVEYVQSDTLFVEFKE
mgnify:CR=1 FL=1